MACGSTGSSTSMFCDMAQGQHVPRNISVSMNARTQRATHAHTGESAWPRDERKSSAHLLDSLGAAGKVYDQRLLAHAGGWATVSAQQLLVRRHQRAQEKRERELSPEHGVRGDLQRGRHHRHYHPGRFAVQDRCMSAR
jgi:hypothetical protein